MYFTGHIAIDPKDISQIIRPTKAFYQLAKYSSRDDSEEAIERETYTAAAILQRLNVAFRSLDVTNIIHLSKDGVTIYDDQDGVDDDFRVALIEFAKRTMSDLSKEFRVLTLALEHTRGNLEYLIEIEVVKQHPIHELPINIRVNAVYKEFSGTELTEPQEAQLAAIFADQIGHDSVKSHTEAEFNRFLGELEAAFREYANVEDLQLSSQTKILKPHTPRPTHGVGFRSDPVFCRDYHWDHHTSYIPIWAMHLDSSNVELSDCEILDPAEIAVEEVLEDSESGTADGQSTPEQTEDNSLEPSVETEDVGGSSADADSSPASSSGGWLSGLFGANESSDTSNSGGLWGGGDSGDSGGDGGGSSCGSGCGGCGGGD